MEVNSSDKGSEHGWGSAYSTILSTSKGLESFFEKENPRIHHVSSAPHIANVHRRSGSQVRKHVACGHAMMQMKISTPGAERAPCVLFISFMPLSSSLQKQVCKKDRHVESPASRASDSVVQAQSCQLYKCAKVVGYCA